MNNDRPLAGRRIGLVTAWASRSGGGVFEAVVRQAAMIRELGGEALVFALEDAFSDTDAARFSPSPVSTFRVIGPRQIGFAPALERALIDADLDLLHLHGIWMYPSRAATNWKRRTGRPYIISPHGMLDPWITSKGKWKKVLAMLGYERRSWHCATAFHALTADEARDVNSRTGTAKAFIVPNPAPPVDRSGDQHRLPVLLYIGRIHPKKNLLALVDGWRNARKTTATHLVIAGWGADDDVANLTAKIAAAGGQISYAGPVYGPKKDELLRSAQFTVLPSLSEGLPVSVLEGWAVGTPALLTEQCHLPEGLASGAALSCGTDPADISRAIEHALELDLPAWRTMSEAASSLAAGPFAPATIGRLWKCHYMDALAIRDAGA